MPAPDICIAWLNVHGGAFHKLIRLHEALLAAGLRCELLFSAGPPRGLKAGQDVPVQAREELAEKGVLLLPRGEVLERARGTKARLLLTDSHHDPDLPGLIAAARAGGVITAQMATLLGDFTCHGAEHLLLQHPLTLFFELEYNRTKESKGFFKASSIGFTGNIFFEPTLNGLHGGWESREAFCSKYGFDARRPILLWLPSTPDARDESYGQVARAVAGAGMNLAVKLHPWEYAYKKHGGGAPHPWGLADTSDKLWGVTAVDEADTTWAYHFCDAAILRGSAMSLELPFWERPSLILPSAQAPRLFEAQAALARSCAVTLPSVEALGPSLASGPLPVFSPQDYALAKANVRLDTGRDAYDLTVEALANLLAGTPPKKLAPAALRRLYDPHVTPELLRAMSRRRAARLRLARLWRSLGAQG